MGLACRGWLDGVVNGERENCAKVTMSATTQGGFDAGGVCFEGVPKGFEGEIVGGAFVRCWYVREGGDEFGRSGDSC